MTQTYRTTDNTRWGAGKGSRLTPAEVDINFWDIIQDILALQAAMPDAAAQIDYFEVVGIEFYVHMTDATVLGPYDLPQIDFVERGEWLPSTVYTINDLFTINGGLYRVIWDHTSDTTFDAGENDGMGHDYYSLWIQTPGNALPTGGAVGQVVQKASLAEFAVTWGWKYPTGGTEGKYLRQMSSTQDDAEWSDIDASEVVFVPVSGSPLAGADNVADALEIAAGSGGGGDAIDVSYTPVTDSLLTATNVQEVIDEIEVILHDIAGAHANSWEPAPTGNVSTSEKAMGLGTGGSAFLFTPEVSGRVMVWIAGMVLNSSGAGNGVTIKGRYGSGSAPVNGAVGGFGTQFSTAQEFVASTAAGQQGFIVMGLVPNLAVGTTYWFDLTIVAVGAGGATVKNVQFNALEVPG